MSFVLKIYKILIPYEVQRRKMWNYMKAISQTKIKTKKHNITAKTSKVDFFFLFVFKNFLR